MTDSIKPQSKKTTRQVSPAPTRRRRGRQLTSTQVTFAAIVAIGLMLAVNFSTRIQADRDLQNIRARVVEEIEFLRREQAALIEELAYAGSDAYVEDWARSEGMMIREGEVLVILVPVINQLQATQEPVFAEATDFDVPIETTRGQQSNWQLWWALFFDGAPPEF